MKILGIDPGTRITGFGLIEVKNNKAIYLSSGCIKTKNTSMANKLHTIFEGVKEISSKFQPAHISIELAFADKNYSTAIKLGQARGVAIVAACKNKIPLFEYSPRQIKKAVVGYGNADKTQVQHMVKLILNLSHTPQTDAADALAIALCHYNSYRFQI